LNKNFKIFERYKKKNLYVIIKITNLLDIQIRILLMIKKTWRSTIWYIFLLGISLISWKSQLQKNVNIINCWTWIFSLTECIKQALCFKILLKEIFNQGIKFIIMVDNKACIAIAQDTNSKGRCKHIDIRYKLIQEKIMKN